MNVHVFSEAMFEPVKSDHCHWETNDMQLIGLRPSSVSTGSTGSFLGSKPTSLRTGSGGLYLLKCLKGRNVTHMLNGERLLKLFQM